MNLCFNGFGENVLTFEADSTLETAGVFVKFTSDGKVAPCAQGDKICGYAVSVRAGYAAVQLKGYVCAAKEGDLDFGWQGVSAGGKGKIAADANGTQVLVVSADADTVGFIL
ncbi:MAG: hypothetical protein IJA62_06060 [Ruminococcus sp.]|nr:hypothetical protein [Ruminococcus sp.]